MPGLRLQFLYLAEFRHRKLFLAMTKLIAGANSGWPNADDAIGFQSSISSIYPLPPFPICV